VTGVTGGAGGGGGGGGRSGAHWADDGGVTCTEVGFESFTDRTPGSYQAPAPLAVMVTGPGVAAWYVPVNE
jgi:hypothetical protein